MSDLTFDGNIKVSFVPTISNIDAPTTTELNAGTSLEDDLTPDGLKTPFDTATVDTSSLASTFGTQGVGRRTPNLSLTFKMFNADGTDRDARTVLTYRAAGYLVVRRNKAHGTAWASSDPVEVYPIEVGQASATDPAPNEVQKATVMLAATSDPSLDGAVA